MTGPILNCSEREQMTDQQLSLLVLKDFMHNLLCGGATAVIAANLYTYF